MKMGLALETAQRYDEAIASLKLFMATKPQEEVLRKTQDEIYKIEAKRDKAAKDRVAQEKATQEAQAKAAREARERQQEAAVKEARTADDWIKRLDGARYIYYPNNVAGAQIIDIKDGMLIRSVGDSPTFGPGHEFGRAHIQGRTFKVDTLWGNIYTISEDGGSIEEACPPGGSPPRMTYRRQR